MSGWLLIAGGVVIAAAAVLVATATRVARAARDVVPTLVPAPPATGDVGQIPSDLLVRIEDMVERNRDATVPEDPPR